MSDLGIERWRGKGVPGDRRAHILRWLADLSFILSSTLSSFPDNPPQTSATGSISLALGANLGLVRQWILTESLSDLLGVPP